MMNPPGAPDLGGIFTLLPQAGLTSFIRKRIVVLKPETIVCG